MKKLTKTLASLFLIFILQFATISSVSADYRADLAVPNLQLTDRTGNTKGVFFANEPIYVRVTYKNIGTGTAENQYTSSGNIWSQIYGDKPSDVAFDTPSDIHIWLRHPNFIAPNTTLKYESFPGGQNVAAFEGDNYFTKSTEGTYTARAFINYDKLAQEWYYGNNQLALTYTVKQYSTTPLDTSPTALCDSGTLRLNLGTRPSGWVKWAIRIDDASNPWNGTTPNTGDTIINDYTSNTYSRSARVGITYGWWYHALSSTGTVLSTKSGFVHCVTAPPANLKATRSGSTITLDWSAVSSATKYAIRVNDLSNGWGGDTPLTHDIVNNNVTNSSFSFTAQSGHAYNWWVHAVDGVGAYSRPSTAYASY